MNELKAYRPRELVMQGRHNEPIYLKSEADKAISELEESHKMEVEQLLMEIVKLKEHVKDLILDNYLKDKEIRRQKYKRCLANARIAQDDWHLHNTFYAMGHQEFEKRKCDFYDKWHRRWLKIAEKFKEC